MINAAALAVVALTAAVNGIDTEQLPLWRQLAFLVLALLAYLHGRRLAARHGAQVLLVVAALVLSFAVVDRVGSVSAAAMLGVFVMLPWFAGRYRRHQAELLRVGEERVARLERERELVAERAQAWERARIAADLHDSVGHDLALISLRAGALELDRNLEASSREAAAALRASAVDATDRLRRTVGLLREGAAPVTPLDEPVRELVARAVGAGLEVRLDADEAGPSTALVDRAVYRVVQEALTNATKHAPGGAVVVRVERDGGSMRVNVRSAPGRALASAAVAGQAGPAVQGGPPERVRREAAPRPGIGSGLAGLAERVRLLGGVFSAEPERGGFTVDAVIPWKERE